MLPSIYTQGKIISLLMATKAGFHKYLHILVEDISCHLTKFHIILQRLLQISSYLYIIHRKFLLKFFNSIAEHISSVHGCYLEAMSAVAYSGHNGNAVHFIGDEERMKSIYLSLIIRKILSHNTSLLFLRCSAINFLAI